LFFLTSNLVLYFPSRYTQTSLILVLLLFVTMNLGPAMRTSWRRFRILSRSSKALVVAASVVAAVALYFLLEQADLWNRLGAVGPSYKGILLGAYMFLIGCIALRILLGRTLLEPVPVTDRLAPKKELSIVLIILLAGLVIIAIPPDSHLFIPIEPQRKDLVTFFQTTPKDSLTAGNPCFLDYVPMAAGRQVLFSCEFYVRGVTEPVLDNFRAYYADSLSQVRAFCDAYSIDYLVVVPRSFNASEDMWIFFEPLNSILVPEVLSKPGYVLEDIPPNLRVYDGQEAIVMDCASDDIGQLKNLASQVNGLGILEHSEIPETLSQAEKLEITIKWVAEEELTTDYDICFSLKDESGQSRQESCEPLSSRLPSSQWQVPEIRYETYRFQVSPYLESGDYTIVAMVESNEETGDEHELALGEITYSAVPRTFGAADIDPESAYGITWNAAIALADYDVALTDADTLRLDVQWHTLKRLTESYKLFVHVRDAASGEIASQIDTIPRNWTYPTNWWEANEIIDDRLSISLADLDSGRFELWLGFYNEKSGERLPLSNVQDPPFTVKDDAVKIYEFVRSDSGSNN